MKGQTERKHACGSKRPSSTIKLHPYQQKYFVHARAAMSRDERIPVSPLRKHRLGIFRCSGQRVDAVDQGSTRLGAIAHSKTI
mmetsp:Transcript_50243/g.133426  ORF Transcript_50243/g.133426 Transcript_50243/m.133426 type:complete len:83 (+) Transcript_50243:119-367(+)